MSNELPSKITWFRLPEFVINIFNKTEKGDGVSNTFTSNDGKTITVVDGIITSIV